MLKVRMNCLFLFLACLVATSVPAAEEWVSFQPTGTEGYPEVIVLSSTADEFVFQIKFPGMKTAELARSGEFYQALSIPGGGRTHNLGWAELPTWSRFVAVPQGAAPQVEIMESNSLILSGYHVYPAQEQPVDKAGAPEPDFVKDSEFYRKDQLYPDRLAFLDQPKIIRGCNVSSLTLFPVQYNPARGELRIVSQMQVRVSFPGSDAAFIDPRLKSPYFDALFQNLILNYSSLSPSAQIGGKSSTGCDFLIITHPDFEAWAESLAYWKNLSGIPTWVRNTTQTGSDTGSIRVYLQNAYNTWDPPPSFLLLIGDAEFIPLFYRSIHPYDWLKTGTDLYYTTLEGSDIYPDLFPGRISVDNEVEVGVVISKILQYQRSPVTTPEAFYDNALAAGFFQDRDYDGYADRFFLQTSENLRDFLIGSHGKTVERCYTKTPGSSPCCYYYGDLIPFGLVWTGNAAQINNSIDNGVFLVTHRDHGGVDGWGDPEYYTSDLASLSNQDRLPVVLSINCETGHFDNETDSPGHETPSSAVGFCEAFSRKANGGAVGIFGHTRVSWSGLNDELAKGFYDAIWPDYDPSYPGGGSTQPIYSPMYRMGTMLNFGKFWMHDKYYLTGGDGYPWGSDLESTESTFEMGTWFGDPTMQIWTEVPQAMEVSHPDTILLGEYPLAVTITSGGSPVESVLVCIMSEEIYQVGHTDDLGEAAFSCSTSVEGTIYLTATKHNFRPYQGFVTVVSGAFTRGDANGDEIIDIADVIFLTNYLYKGEAAPFPYEAGEVTCEGIIDVADVIFLLNYLFKEGPTPDCS